MTKKQYSIMLTLAVAMSCPIINSSCSGSAGDDIAALFSGAKHSKQIIDSAKKGDIGGVLSGVSDAYDTYQRLRPITAALGAPIDQYLAKQAQESSELKAQIAQVDKSIEAVEDYNSSLNKQTKKYSSQRSNIIKAKDKKGAKQFNADVKEQSADAKKALAQVNKDLKALRKRNADFSSQIKDLEEQKASLQAHINTLNSLHVPTNL